MIHHAKLVGNQLSIILLLFVAFPLHAQQVHTSYSNESTILKLWPNQAPFQLDTTINEVHERTDKLRVRYVHTPTIEVFLPEGRPSPSPAVLLFPGGGYSALVYEEAGTKYAKWLNERGLAGIVVKYRLPNWATQDSAKWVPLADAQRAMRLVRQHANQWNIDPDRIGVMGSSAGGHVASSISTLYDEKLPTGLEDVIEEQSAKPNFSILVYPVISMFDPQAHKGSRRNLLGESYTEPNQTFFSTHLRVDTETPPTFLIHSTDDKSVSVQNSMLYYNALLKHGVTSTMHIFQDGGHGFGMGEGRGSVEGWLDILEQWLIYNGLD